MTYLSLVRFITLGIDNEILLLYLKRRWSVRPRTPMPLTRKTLTTPISLDSFVLTKRCLIKELNLRLGSGYQDPELL